MVLYGLTELADLFAVTRHAVLRRRKLADFPAPAAELACGPVWTHEQLVEYARQRCERYVERPAIQALAEESR